METFAAAVEILAFFRRKAGGTSPAVLFHSIPRTPRAAAFRLLSKLGLIEVAYIGGGGAKNWRATAKALALRDGEELSAVSK